MENLIVASRGPRATFLLLLKKGDPGGKTGGCFNGILLFKLSQRKSWDDGLAYMDLI